MAFVLYEHPLSTPSRTVKVLARRIGVEFRSVNINIFEDEQYKPDYIEKNPFHCVPTIEDNGFYLWESRAILLYLIKKYAPDSPLYPKDPKERSLVDAMLHFELGSLFYPLEHRVVSYYLTSQDDPDYYVEQIDANLWCLDGVLATQEFSAGNYLTLADISIANTLSLLDV